MYKISATSALGNNEVFLNGVKVTKGDVYETDILTADEKVAEQAGLITIDLVAGTETVGPQGYQGAAGAQGSQGAQGAAGVSNVAGPQGPAGAGAQGAQGSQGAQGAAGTTVTGVTTDVVIGTDTYSFVNGVLTTVTPV